MEREQKRDGIFAEFCIPEDSQRVSRNSDIWKIVDGRYKASFFHAKRKISGNVADNWNASENNLSVSVRL